MTNTPKQQGDVILKPVDKLPDRITIVSRGRCILAHGESGHSHVVDSPGAKLYKSNDNIFLDLKEATDLIHEEHGSITLEPGIWEIGQVNEYDYFSEMVRKVVD